MESNDLLRQTQLEFLSHYLPLVIFEWIYSIEGAMEFKYISPSAKNIFGISSPDMKNYLDYIDPSQHQMIADEHLRCKADKSPFDLEIRLVREKFSTKWVHVYASFTYEDVYGNKFYTGYISDITHQKTSQDRIKEHKLFYENTMNEIPLAIFVMNMKNQIIYKNKLFDDLVKTRRKKRNFSLQTSERIFTDIYFNESEINDVLINKTQQISEEVLFDDNHALIYFLNWLIPVLDADLQIIQIVGYSLNITGRKLIENKLAANEVKHREIIDKMNLGLIEVNFNRDIIFANDTFLKMTGLTFAEVNKFDIDALIDSIEQTDLYSCRKDTWKTQKAKECALYLNGDEVWWLLNITTQFDDDGNISIYLIVCLDITEQKILEKELILSKEMAEKNSSVKDIFLANMSHEIRTPLNAMIGLSNLLTKTNLNATQEKYTRLLKTSADNLLAIVNDVLDLSKIKSGNVKIEETPFNIYEVIKDIIRIFSNKADEKGIFLNLVTIHTYNGEYIVGDQYKFSQIISNLINNAIKFTEKGGVTVSCDLVHEDDTEVRFQITISDTGIGIDEEFIDKIYDKFSQENDSTTRIYGGTGLGMSITKELLAILNGSIYVMSQKYKGTDFVINIPFRKLNASASRTVFNVNDSRTDLKSRKILVVDDNDMNRLVASMILAEHGAEIREAENGFDAIDIIKKEHIDVVLMDVQMPVINGYETTRHIRSLGFTNPIIALTAYAISEEKDRCMEAGMDELITKPYEEHYLLSMVTKAMDHAPDQSIIKDSVTDQNGNVKIIDLTYLRRICNKNREQFKRMIELFVAQTKKQMNDMLDAHHHSDVQKIKFIVHQMKPSIQMLGIHEIARDIHFLENIQADMVQDTRTEIAICKIGDVLTKVWHQIDVMDLETYPL